MNSIKIILLLTLFTITLNAQSILSGKVKEETGHEHEHPLVGANIFWLGTSVGTTSDETGTFSIPFSQETNKLVVSFVGYLSDTLTITDQNKIEVALKSDLFETDDVEVVAAQKSTFIDYLAIDNSSIITKRELHKAACCDLSESFETNPSIDVSFTDAITGTKQIEMLGLAGTYTQTTMENLPFLRGLMSNAGLNFVPGTWIESINVSKGIGSVVNGFESITGQIDIGMMKPFSAEQEKMNINIYANNEQRFEGNLNYRMGLTENISSVTMLHASSRNHAFDINDDSFMDMPKAQTFNIMQRWKYSEGEGLESQLGFQYVNDKKDGGTLEKSNPVNNGFIFSVNQENLNIYGKTGYVFPDNENKSFGIQWSLNKYSNSSRFGNRLYTGDQKSGYFNFIYQSTLGEHDHKFRTGMSFLFDEYEETFDSGFYQRIERIPGMFFEYTFTHHEQLSIVAGLRGDYHNHYDFMFTPRLHVRYTPNEDWIIRAAAGRGYRTSNLFVEYASIFASSRQINIISENSYGYGLEQESAWNFGINLTHYFLFDWREATISFDLYRTQFESLIIPDLDTDARSVTFYSVDNGAYSNSLQLELNIEPLENFSTRIAYRFLDVKNKINNEWKEKPLTAKHRALLNLAYSTEEDEDDTKMSYDLTLQWLGRKRIPSTITNPENLRARENSPDFIIVNAQITRTFFKNFDFYIGVENLFDFRQDNPIIDPFNPNSEYFDASLIWGPVNGRMIYAGLRYDM